MSENDAVRQLTEKLARVDRLAARLNQPLRKEKVYSVLDEAESREAIQALVATEEFHGMSEGMREHVTTYLTSLAPEDDTPPADDADTQVDDYVGTSILSSNSPPLPAPAPAVDPLAATVVAPLVTTVTESMTPPPSDTVETAAPPTNPGDDKPAPPSLPDFDPTAARIAFVPSIAVREEVEKEAARAELLALLAQDEFALGKWRGDVETLAYAVTIHGVMTNERLRAMFDGDEQHLRFESALRAGLEQQMGQPPNPLRVKGGIRKAAAVLDGP